MNKLIEIIKKFNFKYKINNESITVRSFFCTVEIDSTWEQNFLVTILKMMRLTKDKFCYLVDCSIENRLNNFHRPIWYVLYDGKSKKRSKKFYLNVITMIKLFYNCEIRCCRNSFIIVINNKEYNITYKEMEGDIDEKIISLFQKL